MLNQRKNQAEQKNQQQRNLQELVLQQRKNQAEQKNQQQRNLQELVLQQKLVQVVDQEEVLEVLLVLEQQR